MLLSRYLSVWAAFFMHLSVLWNLGTFVLEYLQPWGLYSTAYMLYVQKDLQVHYPYHFTAANGNIFSSFYDFWNSLQCTIVCRLTEIPTRLLSLGWGQDICHFQIAYLLWTCFSPLGTRHKYLLHALLQQSNNSVTVPVSEPAALSCSCCGRPRPRTKRKPVGLHQPQ